MKKPPLTCRFFCFLFHWIPLPFFQGWILRFHFDRCNICRNEFFGEDFPGDFLVSSEELKGKVDLWENVRSTIRFRSRELKKGIRRSWSVFLAVLSILIVLLILLLFFIHLLLTKGSGSIP